MRDLLAMIIVAAILIVPVVCLIWIIVGWQCSNYETATGRNTKMTGLTCYVQVKDQWFSFEQVRSVE